MGTATLKEIADHISITERNSADAERDSKDVKLFAFLRAQLESGEPVAYPALVTDVRNFGFFVDVSGLAMSGLVPLSLMEDDFYVFDEARRNLVGRRTRRMIRLGDRLTVQVARVDRYKKQVDFCLAAEKATTSRPPSGRTDGRRPETKRAAGRNEQRREPQRGEQRPQRDQRREPPRDQRREDSRPARPQGRAGKPGTPGTAGKPQLGRENKFMLKTSIRTFGNQSRRRR